jgi:hypothetical protein
MFRPIRAIRLDFSVFKFRVGLRLLGPWASSVTGSDFQLPNYQITHLANFPDIGSALIRVNLSRLAVDPR